MKISNIFSNGMILQRDVENKIFGNGEQGEEITLCFDGREYKTVTDASNNWEIKLPAYPAGGAHKIEIQSQKGDHISISDVYFGDVFLLGGQSNMELPVLSCLDACKEEVRTAKSTEIRMFQVAKDYDFSLEPKLLDSGEWVSVNPKSVMEFSAIGYFFADYKNREDGVPVGLVHTAVGGAPVESLMSKENVLSNAEEIRKTHPMDGACDNNKNMGCIYCYEKMYEEDSNPEFIKNTVEEDNKRIEAWNRRLEEGDSGLKLGWTSKWSDEKDITTFSFPGTFYQTKYENYRGTIWVQKVIQVPEEYVDRDSILYLGTLIDADKTYVNGKLVGSTDFKYPPRRYVLSKGDLKPGENVISIRLTMDNNIGGFIPDMPYYLKCGKDKIELSGKWKIRKGFECDVLEGPTFFIWHPSALYYSMIASLKGIKFKSILFYQGESNCGHPEYYGKLFKAMVEEWRSLFGDIPMIYAEVTHYMGDGPVYTCDPFDGVREVQRQIWREIPNSYLVKTYDLGQYNELHPQNKKDVAKRFYDVYKTIQ